jgi:hypothetical protein
MTTKEDLATSIDAIENAYEYMLAYAAQGRDQESVGGDGPPVRATLQHLHGNLALIGTLFADLISERDAPPAYGDFCKVLKDDAGRAGKAVELVLASSNITSQLVDNLNASLHLRTLLTDMFLLDEALKTSAG